ncbi:Epsin-3, clathrin recruitment and traffic between the Golgi and endosome [Coemansia sp. RSA 2703]|nr:Epsin-3, clathrin recruitment and traffic between the Golgi and endosome [Coemansia sp. RSA 2703]KAJ2379401.1 Epsin-3, clathrin recruitment and traffic between the Golgi and endosome [Coemansia sp. RSA 2607]KAJ2398427.1 Epsin-3, clathrin recruitment and traffic between the Golgi and endosome [Coemansia sp. RSA 2603]
MDKLSEISKWDVLNVYNKVKNVVMNYTELEIKVHEATGPEPWGASSTLMREIADATHNRKNCDEIMPAIYMRFNDTDPSNWRQVYKALQLLEFLVKNGSENVVDEVRGHITIVKMLKNFHHIDANGKDQGINVRHRSKELVDLVQNSELLREERKKAKDNRGKYSGFAGGTSQYGGFGNTDSVSSSTASRGKYSGFGSGSAGGSSASKYIGFGSDQFMSSSSRYDYRSDSGSSGANYRDDSDSRRTATPATSSNAESGRNSRQKSPPVSKPAPAQPVVADLFSFDDDDNDVSTSFTAQPLSPAPSASTSKPGSDLLTSFALPGPSTTSAPPKPAAIPSANALDDDWGDFQGGSSTSASVSVSVPLQAAPLTSNAVATKSTNTMVDLMGGDDLGLGFQPLAASPAANSQTPKYNISGAFQQPLSPTTASNTPIKKETTAKPAASGAFSDIWDMSSELLSMDSLSISKKSGSSVQNQKQSSKVPMNKLGGSNQQNSLI